jgi:predicted enzyme related to lactoylglutathione lyase
LANPFVHIELDTNDLPRARAFYSKLFAWKLDTDSGNPDYTMLDTGEGARGGMMKHPHPGAPSMWLPYVGVADIDAVSRRAVELGGTVAREKTEIPGFGWFALLVDPTGAMIGVMQMRT